MCDRRVHDTARIGVWRVNDESASSSESCYAKKRFERRRSGSSVAYNAANVVRLPRGQLFERLFGDLYLNTYIYMHIICECMYICIKLACVAAAERRDAAWRARVWTEIKPHADGLYSCPPVIPHGGTRTPRRHTPCVYTAACTDAANALYLTFV